MKPAIAWNTVLENTITVLVIVLVAVIVRIVLEFVIRRVVRGVVSGVKRRQASDDTRAIDSSPLAAVRIVQRTRTLGSVLTNVVTVATVIVALIAIVNVALPAAAGAFTVISAALGVGLGIGSQGLVRDVINGISMISEDQLGVGDVVDTGFATGVVEAVGIRTTRVRDVNGVLWYVHNGEILRVGNMSQGWARVIIDLAVPRSADVDAIEDLMLATALEMADEPKWKRVVLEKPEIWGIESISAEAVIVRIVVTTRTGMKDQAARELRSRLKRTLDENDVQLPSLNQVVLSGFEGAGSVSGARPPSTAPVAAQPTRKPRRSRAKPKDPGI